MADRKPGYSFSRWVGLILAGLLLVIIGIALHLLLPPGKVKILTTTLSLAVGGVLCVSSTAGLLFCVAAYRSFEWYIAWQYLRDLSGRRSKATLIVGGALAAGAVVLYVSSLFWGKVEIDGLVLGPSQVQRLMQGVALGAGVLAYIIILFGILLRSFSLFTSISIFGVFLGTSALVIVLSVMGGFENDLRRKIIGTTSHLMISRPQQAFSNYREVSRQISRMKETLAYSPYIESEVMVTSSYNLSGVLLRGINPRLIGKVTDLPKYLNAAEGEGSLDNLLHPERLAKMPEARFRPLITEPLGKPIVEPGAKDAALDDDALAPDTLLDAGAHPRTRAEQRGGQETLPPQAPRPGPTKKGSLTPLPDAAGGSTVTHRGKQAHDDISRAQKLIESRRKLIEQLESTPLSKRLITKETKMWDVESEIGKKVPPRPIYPGIILGAELAKNLRLYVGDDLSVVAPLGGMSPAGPIPKSKPFRVAGIFYSGFYEYDNKFAYVTIPAAQRFLGMDDEVTGIEVKVREIEEATPLAEKLRTLLRGQGFLVQDWKEMNKNLFTALKLEKVAMFLLLTFITLVASFSIITNLIMVVIEKMREISTLKTMGATHQSILKVFLYAGLYIGMIGMSVGVFTGVAICLFLANVGLPIDPEVYYISVLPVRMTPLDIGIIALAAVSLSFLATIYPAWMAARLKPVDGLRRYEG